MSFNPDISKHPHEVFCKPTIVNHPSATFNDIPVAQTGSQKHLGIILNKKLNFEEQLNKIMWKVNKRISVTHKLQSVEPRPALLITYECFYLIHMNGESPFI